MHQQMDHKYEPFLQSLDETRTSMKIIEEKRLNGKTLTCKTIKLSKRGQNNTTIAKYQPINDQMKKRNTYLYSDVKSTTCEAIVACIIPDISLYTYVSKLCI